MARIQDALLTRVYCLDGATVFVPHEYYNGSLGGSLFDALSGEYRGNYRVSLQDAADDNLLLFKQRAEPKDSDLARALQAMKRRELESLPFEEALAKIAQ